MGNAAPLQVWVDLAGDRTGLQRLTLRKKAEGFFGWCYSMLRQKKQDVSNFFFLCWRAQQDIAVAGKAR